MISIDVPKTLAAGDSFHADFGGTREEYPTEEYSLSFVYSVAGRQAQKLVPENRKLSISWKETKTWSGVIQWRLYAAAKDGSQRRTIATGEIATVQPFAVSQFAAEGESHEEKVLKAIEAVLEQQATHEQMSVSINGRTLMRRSTSELFDLRQKYLDLVRQKKAIEKNGGSLVFGKIRLKMPRY